MHTIIGTDISLAKQLLDQNQLVSIPTETVYGLAGNGLSAEAISQIYLVKNRPQFNPLILHTHNLDSLSQFVIDIPKKIEILIRHAMPGPLTVLLPKSELVPDIVTAGSSRVAIRIPNHPLSLKLLQSLDYPLAAPSANPSGYVSPTSANHVFQQLEHKIPYILDGGICHVGLESTIVGYEANRIVVYRHGGMSISDMEDLIQETIDIRIQHSKPETPGALKSHYATQTPLFLGHIDELIRKNLSKKIVLINYSQPKSISVFKQYILTENENVAEAAQNLFSTMRNADNDHADVILCEYAPNQGIGLAINDRLSRAQHLLK